jgi:hypothetical protein
MKILRPMVTVAGNRRENRRTEEIPEVGRRYGKLEGKLHLVKLGLN